MTIKINTYVKKNGELMLYINRSNGVSVGLNGGYSPYGKEMTAGKRNAVTAACAVVLRDGKPFTGDLAQHLEGGFCAPRQCGPFTLVGTDVATIGGMHVGSDGSYVILDGKIAPISHPFEEGEGATPVW